MMKKSSKTKIEQQAALLRAADLGGTVKEMRALLAQGVDPNSLHQGKTPLTIAARGGNVQKVKALLEAGAEVNQADGEGQAPLDSAIFSGSVDIVNLLLAQGATTERNPSILCNPARWGHTEIVKALLKAGVSPRHHIRRLIYLASEDGHTEIVRAILTANKRKVDKRALIRPLFMARSQGNLEMVNLLLEAGADPQMEPTIRRSPQFTIMGKRVKG